MRTSAISDAQALCNMGDVVAAANDGKDAVVVKKDKLFDPSVDMLVNDFDDERTLEEEEALAAGEAEDPNAELSSLQKVRKNPSFVPFLCPFHPIVPSDIALTDCQIS